MREIVAPRRADRARGLAARRGHRASSTTMARSTRPSMIRESPQDEEISVYRQGDWLDLCSGPASALDRQARPGLQADEARRRLLARRSEATRSCSASTARPGRDQKQLDAYLHQLEEAEKRDHRRLGREMDLFHLQEEAVGSVFWHPKGWTLCRTLEGYMRSRLEAAGYLEVRTPAAARPQPLGGLGPLGEVPRGTCSSAEDRGRRRPGAQADELPLPCADLQSGPARAIATCRCAWPSSAPATATSRPARCTASCACAPSPRTTPISSAPRIRSRRRAIAFCELLISVYRDLGFNDVTRASFCRPAAAPRRHRRGLGPGRSAR